MQRLSIPGLPSLAIAEGATTPAPTYNGLAWSTTTSQVMRWNGTAWNAIVNGAAIKPASITIDAAGTGAITVNGSVSGSGSVGASTSAGGLSLRSTQTGTTAFLDLETTPNTSNDSGLVRVFRTSPASNAQSRIAIYSPNTATETGSIYADGRLNFLGGNAATPQASTISAQSAIGGTSTDTAGAGLTLRGGQGTGTGAGGSFVVQLAQAGASSGTALNAYANRLSINAVGNTTLMSTADGSASNTLILQNNGTTVGTQVQMLGQTFTNAGAATTIFGFRGLPTDTAGNGYLGVYVGIAGAATARAALTSTDLVLGGLPTSTAPVAMTLRGPDASGTNVAGADLTLQPARSTGSAVPGKFVIKTAIAGASGATLNAATERFRVEGDTVYITGNINLSGTATGFPSGGGSGTSFTTAPAVAAAGTDQSSATALSATFNFITSGTGGVRLATPSDGAYCTIINHTTSILTVYPSTGGTIDGAGSALSIAPGNALRFSGDSATDWIGVDNNIWDDENNTMAFPVRSGVPSAPPAGIMSLFARSLGGRLMPAFMGPSGLFSVLQPHIARNGWKSWRPQGNNTTITALNAAALSTVGTITAANYATTNIHTRSSRADYLVTTASTSAIAGWRQNFLAWRTTEGFHRIASFCPATGVTGLATRRCFVGMTTAVASPTDVNPSTLVNMVGLGYDAADTNWQLFTNDGTGTATKFDTGLARPSTDRQDIFTAVIFAPPGGASVTVALIPESTGTVYENTFTTDLPTATAAMTLHAWTSVGGTSSVVGITLFGDYIETDR